MLLPGFPVAYDSQIYEESKCHSSNFAEGGEIKRYKYQGMEITTVLLLPELPAVQAPAPELVAFKEFNHLHFCYSLELSPRKMARVVHCQNGMSLLLCKTMSSTTSFHNDETQITPVHSTHLECHSAVQVAFI